jgi:hypothetical protein
MSAHLTSGRALPVTIQAKTRMTRARSMTTSSSSCFWGPARDEGVSCGRFEVEGSVNYERVLVKGSLCNEGV